MFFNASVTVARLVQLELIERDERVVLKDSRIDHHGGLWSLDLR
jgi:hypothetical protein